MFSFGGDAVNLFALYNQNGGAFKQPRNDGTHTINNQVNNFGKQTW